MTWIKRLFERQSIAEPSSKWIEFVKEKPPFEVVLAACYTYDCGWIMDTAWCYEKKTMLDD